MPSDFGEEATSKPSPFAGEGRGGGRLAQGRPKSRIRHPRMGP